jgi:uncharacterized protein (TIGR03083 family)
MGEFTALWSHVLAEAADTEVTPYTPLQDTDDPHAWYQVLADHLVARLHATTGDAPSWMWMPDHQTAGAVARRCANELAIHRYDAQSASGQVTPLDAAVAVDAIDEIFVMLPVWDNPPEGSGLTLRLRTHEGEQRVITLGAEGPRIRREPAPADLTLTGTASDLALLLFERPTIGDVQRDGDSSALDAWYREFRFD